MLLVMASTPRPTATNVESELWLESDKNRLVTGQQALSVSQEDYKKMNEFFLEQQNKLAEMQTTFRRLMTSDLTLARMSYFPQCVKADNLKPDGNQVDPRRVHQTQYPSEVANHKLKPCP